MAATIHTLEKSSRRKASVICELDASLETEEIIESATRYCREYCCELVFLWVLEPRIFSSPFPGSAGAVGTWGLPFTLRNALERASNQGITAHTVVRVGERERIIQAERETLNAEAVFSRRPRRPSLGRVENGRSKRDLPHADRRVPRLPGTNAAIARHRGPRQHEGSRVGDNLAAEFQAWIVSHLLASQASLWRFSSAAGEAPSTSCPAQPRRE